MRSFFDTTIEIETEHEIKDIDVTVDFYYESAEPAVMYYSDGSGYPGAPPIVELNNVSDASNKDWLSELSPIQTERIIQAILYLKSDY